MLNLSVVILPLRQGLAFFSLSELLGLTLGKGNVAAGFCKLSN